jgi:hypothetical protein
MTKILSIITVILITALALSGWYITREETKQKARDEQATKAHQTTIDSLMAANRQQIIIINRHYKMIVDSLITVLSKKVTYQINNEFNKLKAKRNSEIKINLDNTIKPTTINKPEPEGDTIRKATKKFRLFGRKVPT